MDIINFQFPLLGSNMPYTFIRKIGNFQFPLLGSLTYLCLNNINIINLSIPFVGFTCSGHWLRGGYRIFFQFPLLGSCRRTPPLGLGSI